MAQYVLWDYQEDAVNRVLSEWKAGVKRQIVALPTGTGKTVILVALAKRLGELSEGCRTIVIAHRDELLDQVRMKVGEMWPGATTGTVQGGSVDLDHDVVVASIASLSQLRTLELVAAHYAEQVAAGRRLLVVTDEAHHAAARTYQQVYARLAFDLHVGLTATASRADKVPLSLTFDKVTVYRSVVSMILAGRLCNVRDLVISSNVDLDSVKTVDGDFDEASLAQAVNVYERNQMVVDAFKRFAATRSTLVFAANVAHAQALAELFRQAGVTCQAVYGEMPKEQRRKALEAYQAGQVRVLTNCQLLTEGVDLPRTSAIILARPTKSANLFAQMVGRGLRLYPNKEYCLVIDVADVSRQHDVMSLPDLIGDGYQRVPEARAPSGKKRVADAGQDVLSTVVAFDGPAGRMRVQEQALLERGRWGWIEGEHNRWSLNIPEAGLVCLDAITAGYMVRFRNERVVAEIDGPLALDWALASAQAFVQQAFADALILVDREAPWRKRKAPTPAQQRLLWALGTVFPGTLTSGEAAEIIDRAKIGKAGGVVDYVASLVTDGRERRLLGNPADIEAVAQRLGWAPRSYQRWSPPWQKRGDEVRNEAAGQRRLAPRSMQ